MTNKNKKVSLENSEKEVFNRSTLEVAKSIIDSEHISTRTKKYLKEENRLCFLSVWTAFNSAFSVIADIYEDSSTSESVKSKIEPIYKGVPVGFNLPLEVRVPPEVRVSKLQDADKARDVAGKAGPIIVKGYNDPESLENWKNSKNEQESLSITEEKDSSIH